MRGWLLYRRREIVTILMAMVISVVICFLKVQQAKNVDLDKRCGHCLKTPRELMLGK